MRRSLTENFKSSDSCRWREQGNIKIKKNSGESNSKRAKMVNAWKKTSLPTLLSNYDLKDVYNADQFGLF